LALDHYISQVHLKQFLRQSDSKLLIAVRKSDLTVFPPRPKDVCRVEDGSTNQYLTENRAVEEFLREIEPAYEPCLARLKNGEFDWECRQVFGGFLAYIQTYTPAALRMFDPMTRTLLTRTIKIFEKSGDLLPLDCPEIPDWHGKHMSQLTDEGKVRLNIDLKMPQAMATTQLLKIRQSLASSDVTILTPTGNGRFLTSDFPSVILTHHQNKFAQRFLPISPKFGLIFHTQTSIEERDQINHSFVKIGAQKLQGINDEIIKAAENLVFSTHNYPWLLGKIKSLRHFRVEVEVQQVGPMIFSQQRAMETK
jgi:Protein of unknown function (DUF4238)